MAVFRLLTSQTWRQSGSMSIGIAIIPDGYLVNAK